MRFTSTIKGGTMSMNLYERIDANVTEGEEVHGAHCGVLYEGTASTGKSRSRTAWIGCQCLRAYGGHEGSE